MSAGASQEREIREILIAANSGDATDEQLARLDELIRSDDRLARYAAVVLDQQAALAWQGAQNEHSRTSAVDSAPAPAAPSRPESKPILSGLWSGRGWPSGTVSAAFGLGALMASLLWYFNWRADFGRPAMQMMAGPVPSAAASSYEARLVRSTACLWDVSSSGAPAIGSWLTSGESLHLLEGLAEFNLTWAQGGSATLSLEGPAAMMLNTEGMPMLRYGKLTATINARQRPFVLETSVGRLVLTDYGSIGVSAFGNEAEIHVFDGSAVLESAWDVSPRRATAPMAIESGEALRISEGANGQVVVDRHGAEQSYFVNQVSMASDALAVPPTYVAAVKTAKPVGYWRMGHEGWPRVQNEMSPRLECRVEGALGRTGHAGNQAVEFGVTDKGGDIVSDDPLDDLIRDDYSLEVWIKPSHYHVGAVVSLIGQPDTPAGVIPHGVLLELGGSGLIPTAVHHPGRIRFLHRSPASNDTQTGTSCYSTEAYTLRKWQHLVAVKDGAKMRLYINGQQVGEGDDTSPLPKGLHLLVGRLYPARNLRPFKGQLDELALYDRALPAEEIKQHYEMVRPPAPEPVEGPKT